jgi:hypothetical protein
MRIRLILIFALLFGCAAMRTGGKGGDGPLMVRARTTAAGGPMIEAELYWSGNKRVTEQKKQRMIFDIDSKTVTVVDKQHKQYSIRSFDEILKQREVLNKRFDAMSQQQRERVGLGKPITLKPTGKTEKIVGYTAKEYVLDGGPFAGSMWIAEDLQPATWRQWQQVVANAESSGYAGRQLAEAIASQGGFLVRSELTLNLGAKPISLSTEVIEVSAKAAPPDLLVVPEGFHKVEAPIQTR